LASANPAPAASGNRDALIQKYEDLLLLRSGDYRDGGSVEAVYREDLLPRFRAAVRKARRYAYDRQGETAYFAQKLHAETERSAARAALQEENERFASLFIDILPVLAYAYRTPGPERQANPYYRNGEVRGLYIAALEYCYSRGLTELAWLPDHAGAASAGALARGLRRESGDFSTVSLRLGGLIQSVFLMREALRAAGLLDKYRAVVRNLVVNNGALHGAFFQAARAEAGISYPEPFPIEQQYWLNADGARLFADCFWPYYLLVEERAERSRMTAILYQVIDTNIAVKPGTQGTIKPDGTGFHHGAAYVGAYTPYAFEAFAQLLYLARGTGFYRAEHVEAVKLAVGSLRVMTQGHAVAPALRGRFPRADGEAMSMAMARAMAFLAHPDGTDDPAMRARFREFFDEGFFFSAARRKGLHDGVRGIAIRCLGMHRLVADLQRLGTAPAAVPSGVWIKPYAAAAFFRRTGWLATAKGFSQYFWDYEGPLNKHENSFGQNWSYGSLQVLGGGRGAGSAGFDGWDWYHVPGTTASHYPITKRTLKGVLALRRQLGIVQRSAHRNYNTRTFVGGASLGGQGLFVQDLEAVPFTAATNLRGWKSYFFVGDRVLALGTHISGGTPGDATHTTIFQSPLAGSDSPTWLDGRELTGLGFLARQPAGSRATLSDSAGNRYFLAGSSSDLVVSRQMQRSLSEAYEETEGPFAQAYLDHGIQPRGASYQYVLIPADREGAKLRELAADPAAYYQVLEEERMHLVRFPQQGVSAYAFFEAVETPGAVLVRSVNQPAVVIVRERQGSVRLAASVPDIGWQFGKEIGREGSSYAARQFAIQPARQHTLRLMLRGTWCLEEVTAPPGSRAVSLYDGTLLQLRCSDGMSTEVLLRPCEATP
jgi:hypothetical protein